MSQPKHSILSASAADRWMNCPGSVRLSRLAPPRESSIHADEGTAAHELAERCLLAGSDAKEFLGEDIDGFEVTDEMVSAVQIYIDLVRSRHKENGGILHVEKRFDLSDLHPGLFGTNDACVVRKGSRIIVIDFKYGVSPVEATNNKQLLYYALGAANEVSFNITDIEIIIVQPRAPHKNGPIRTWVVDKNYLVEWSFILIRASKHTENDNAQLNRGPWCGYCPAKGLCPKMNEAVVETVSPTIMEGKELSPELLTDAQLVKLIENKKLIEDFIDSAQTYALHRLKNGEKIEGLKLVAGKGRRDWAKPDQAQATLIELLGDKAFEKKLLSVAKAEKELGKNGLENIEVLDIPGSETVAHVSDRRKEVQPLGGKLILNKKGATNA